MLRDFLKIYLGPEPDELVLFGLLVRASICIHVCMKIVATEYSVNTNGVDEEQKEIKDRTLEHPMLK